MVIIMIFTDKVGLLLGYLLSRKHQFLSKIAAKLTDNPVNDLLQILNLYSHSFLYFSSSLYKLDLYFITDMF